MTALGSRNVSLYASKRGVPFYEKMGFKPSKMFRYQTTFPVNRSYLKGINFLGSILIKYVSLNWPQASTFKDYEFLSGSERKNYVASPFLWKIYRLLTYQTIEFVKPIFQNLRLKDEV